MGVKVSRDVKQVTNKITYMERAFREAHDFANTETGVGLQETDRGNFQDIVRKRFPYYFDLLEIFGDRASSKPKVTSYDDLSETSEEEDSEEGEEENEDDEGGIKEVKARDELKRKLTESAYSIQKKNKSSQMVQIFSPQVNQELEKMSRTKNMLLEEKLKLAKKKNDCDGESGESGRSGMSFRERMEVFREFRKFREDFPELSKEKVLKMFPEFKVCYDL